MSRCYEFYAACGVFKISCFCALLSVINAISIPTGKLTPIEPEEPSTAAPVDPSTRKLPAPVLEYTFENPEPPPLDPSFVPIQYDYIRYLSPNGIIYVPLKVKYPKKYKSDGSKDKFGKYYWKNESGGKSAEKYKNYPDHLSKKYTYYLSSQNQQ